MDGWMDMEGEREKMFLRYASSITANNFACRQMHRLWGRPDPSWTVAVFLAYLPIPLGKRVFFWLSSFFSLVPTLLIFLKCVTLKFKNLH
jgi:hypothetical protein